MENINDKCSREEKSSSGNRAIHTQRLLVMWYVKGMRCFVLFFCVVPLTIRATYVIALFSLAIKISKTVCVFYNLNTSITIELLLK